MNRRTLLKMTGSSVLLSGLAGCTQAVDQSAREADRSSERNETSDDESTGNRHRNNSHASAGDHANGSTGTHGHNEGVTGPVSHADVAMITNDDYHLWSTRHQ